jgi:ubiquinone/menaquinone biosynthesis C-methylase UbiE
LSPVNNKNRVCPVENADSLDTRIRRWIQNPRRILSPYVKKGMTVMDFGCGPGYFTLDMARMVGGSGHVFAVDLQEGMLEKLKRKIYDTELKNIITLHKCEDKKIGVTTQLDFVLVFYVLHELPDQAEFFTEVASLIKSGGQVLIVEPPFHVSKSDFINAIQIAGQNGLTPEKGPRMLFNKTLILRK